MINRILLRVKIAQLLYAYQQNPSKSIHFAKEELLKSLEHTYHLYHLVFLLIIDITAYAEQRIEAGKRKYQATYEEKNPNTRFIENQFVAQLYENNLLRDYTKTHYLSWTDYEGAIKDMYEIIIATDFYTEYMNAPRNHRTAYEEDKEIWVKILKNCILESDELLDAIEAKSIYWNDDLDTVVSFVIKTIRKFEQAKGKEQLLLPMFKDDEDKKFALKLYSDSITNVDEHKVLIDEFTKNWDLDRIAFMDVIIMRLAITELFDFPTIPIKVTLNEYIEIAKVYSTERSGSFINGVLDNIVSKLIKENKLVKAKTFR